MHNSWTACKWLLSLALFIAPEMLCAQPWSAGAPAGVQPSPLSHRHPHIPSLDSLFTHAPDARGTVLPDHGGLDERGRPTWTHQVRRTSVDDGRPYTGWTRHILIDNAHRWRFQRFDRGWLVEQVSYYENGTADHHFHTDTTGRNVGSQRMWFDDGHPYLDQFHDAEGRLHGQQLRWNARDNLDWNTRFVHGVEVDASGKPVPSDQRTRPSGDGSGC